MIEFIGWLGAVLLGGCGIPLAWDSYKDKHSHGIGWKFIGMWGIGEVLLIIYIFLTTIDIILLANYLFNLLTLSVVIYWKRFPLIENPYEKSN